MATKSIGLTGRDFSTAAAWASYVNALALTAPEVGEVYNDGGPVADTTIVQIDGYTGANSTNTVTLRAATNQGFATTAGALQWNSANGAALTNNTGYLNTSGAYRFTTGYFILDGLQLRSTSPSARVVMFGGTNVLISNCILRAISTASAAIYSQVGPGRKIQNTVVIHAGTTDCLAVEGVDLLTVDGCTLVKLGAASGVGVALRYSGSVLMRNTAVIGFTTDTLVVSGSFSASCVNNATSSASFAVANAGLGTPQVNVTAADFISLTSGSEDLRIPSISKLRDTGATVGPTTDIHGKARPQGSAYDIGAWEYSAPASGITGNVTLDESVAAGSFSSTASGITGGVTLDNSVAAGTLGALPGVLTTPALKNNTGTLLANVTGVAVNVYNATTGALVVRQTGLTSSGAAVLTITDAALSAGTTYAYEVDLTASSLGRILPTGTAA